MPQTIAVVVSAQLATLHELQSVYGTRDLYDLIEIIAVERYNQRKLTDSARRREHS